MHVETINRVCTILKIKIANFKLIRDNPPVIYYHEQDFFLRHRHLLFLKCKRPIDNPVAGNSD